MDCFSKLVIASLALLSGSANAGYAQLVPPPSWTSSATERGLYRVAANEAIFQNTVRTTASLNVGGQSIKVPSAMRFAANASRYAARASFGNPWIFAAVAGYSAYNYFKDSGYEVLDNQWVKITKVGGGIEYRLGGPDYGQQWAFTTQGALNSYCSVRGLSNCVVSGNYIEYSCAQYGTCATGFSGFEQRTAPESSTVTPATPQEFEDDLAPKDVPDGLPQKLPVPLPVELPIVNPVPLPDTNPQPRPLFVPTGDPLPNPVYDPNSPPGPNNQPYVQPGVRVNPSPTPSEPWRVDLQPVNRPVSSPEPMPEPDSVTPENPDKPSEEQIDFCAKNPDVLACQKLDEPASEELPASEKQISISPDGGWGADNASCPAPKQITVQGRAIPIPFDLFCTWANGMRPIVIAMAWLSAAFILLGARSES